MMGGEWMITKEFMTAFSSSTISLGEPLSKHTSFQIGGPARLFTEPSDLEQLSAMVRFTAQNQLSLLVLGRGSNLLVSDQGFDGLALHMGKNFSAVTRLSSTCLYAQAGADLSRVCNFARDCGLSGLEFAFGIPGSVGGAIYMNAGAYGGEIADVLLWADCVDLEGRSYRLEKEALSLSYRHSVFAENGWVITGGAFSLTPGDTAQISAAMEALLARRKEKQPLEYPSAGSTFKRPSGAFAAALIEQCGLKGARVGGAMVSPKHAGFIINVQNASCADVRALIAKVKNTVKEKTGYCLECEVKLIGE